MENIAAVITLESAKVSCNFEQVEKAIRDTLEEYRGAVFTEESKTYAKKHVASLRAKKRELQDSLRTEKKKYMEPWDAFEEKAKHLIGMYDEPINLINGQIQVFEEKRVEEKKQLIGRIYADIVPAGLHDCIPLERIYNKKWENATVKEKEIRKEILEISEKTMGDIETIQNTESDAVSKALSIYYTNLSLTEAIAYIHNYDRQKQEILEKERKLRYMEEEERIRREERDKILSEQKEREEREEAVEAARVEGAKEAIESLIPDMEGEESLYEYRMSLSADAKEKLEMYMDSVGIEWEMIS